MTHEHQGEHTPEPVGVPIVPAAKNGSFAYYRLQSKTADDLRTGAERIRKLTAGTSQRLLAIGAELCRAKILLDRGEFGSWLASEFDWSERTAQRLMQAAETFGTKSDTVSVLEPTALYQLSAKSTPEAVREEIVARLEAGERPALAEITAEVRHARQAVAKEKAVARTAKAAYRAGLPLPLPAVTRSLQAAGFILERLGEEQQALAKLLEDVEPKALLAALRAGEIPAPAGPSPQPVREAVL